MPFLNLTIEFTHNAATKSVVNAGGNHNNQDAVLTAIDASRSKHKVRQSHVRTWISEMESEGYHVVDAEIPVTTI